MITGDMIAAVIDQATERVRKRVRTLNTAAGPMLPLIVFGHTVSQSAVDAAEAVMRGVCFMPNTVALAMLECYDPVPAGKGLTAAERLIQRYRKRGLVAYDKTCDLWTWIGKKES